MLLIKNDPKYNEQWPRPLVPYKRIYGVDEPKHAAAAGQRRQAVAAPAGGHAVRPGRHVEPVQARELSRRRRAARAASPRRSRRQRPYHGLDPFTARQRLPLNWAQPGRRRRPLRATSDIHAIRILAMEPTTDRAARPKAGRLFYNHATERLRILGEIPVRKFARTASNRLDPDGNPDTSFLAKIPADVAFTFQTLDKDGMVLNMAQTWHQLRPGEIRNDCGGCHAHSQKPTAVRADRRRQAGLPGLRPDAAARRC